MNKVSLFAGIGGDDIASEWAGIETVCFVENNTYCQKVLKKHWPDVPIISEVKGVTKERIQEIIANTNSNGISARSSRNMVDNRNQPREYSPREGQIAEMVESRINLISGGFPCQPHSVAGKRKGSVDERNLWPEFRRIIGEIKPRWVVAENVPGLFSSDAGRFFGEVVTDLAEMGYSVGWATYGAVDVGALHRRNRVFIVGYSEHAGRDATEVTGSTKQGSDNSQTGEKSTCQPERPSEQSEDVADTNRERLQGWVSRELQECSSKLITGERGASLADTQSQPTPKIDNGNISREEQRKLGRGSSTAREVDQWSVEPDVGRVAHGVPSRVDRLKALGNAVVPQQIYPIYRAIVEIENNLLNGEH